MGRQATFIRVKEKKNFNKLVTLMNLLGEEFFEKKCICPVWIITLKRSIKVNSKSFYSGEKFIAIQGQRASQVSPARMFGQYAPDGLEIYTLESFPVQIYYKKSGLIKIKDWEWST